MKTILILITSVLILSSCGNALISDAVIVEQIDIATDGNCKYRVKIKTNQSGSDVYYSTNYRFQVGDSLVSYYENFDKNKNESLRLKKEIDSLKKELVVTKYYLDILKERLIIDTLKRR